MKAARLILVLVFGGGALLTRGAELEPKDVAPGPTVELPPMIVTDTPNSLPWLYATVNGDEYLSRCSARTTRRYIEADQRLIEELRVIVPEEFLARLPSIILLSDESLAPKASDLVALEVTQAGKGPLPTGKPGSIQYLPSLSIDGRDVSAMFAYLDESEFSHTTLLLTTKDLRSRLERRTPMLPPWLVEGILAVHAQLRPTERPLTLRPFIWLSLDESRAIASNPARPRALLPASEMFAPDALRAEGDRHPLRVRTLRTQVGLFVRWALDPSNHARDAFWTFARRASEQRVTPELFAECFGFGFSDLRDRLNDYLPTAIKEPLPLPEVKRSPLQISELRTAERPEVLRIRGEWERLEIASVQRTQPAFAPRYIEQARRTLGNAYKEGDRDPRVLAALGLCEVDAGNAAAGISALEKAMATGISRPRVYYEVARFRFSGLLHEQPANRLFSAAEIAPILEPLRRAIALSPPLPEVFGLLADVWVRCREQPTASDVAALIRGSHDFALNPSVSYRLALALARAGQRVEAAELLTTSVEYVPDEASRARFTQLRAAVTTREPTTR